MKKNPTGLKLVYEYYLEIVKDLTTTVRTIELNIQQYTVVCTLLVIDVYLMDISDDLIKNNFRELTDFEWQKQLRLYYDYGTRNLYLK